MSIFVLLLAATVFAMAVQYVADTREREDEDMYELLKRESAKEVGCP